MIGEILNFRQKLSFGLSTPHCPKIHLDLFSGSADGPQTVCSDGVAIEITGGCHGYLSNEAKGVSFREVFAPGK